MSIHQLSPNYFGLKISWSRYTSLKVLQYLQFSHLTEIRTIRKALFNLISFPLERLIHLADSPGMRVRVIMDMTSRFQELEKVLGRRYEIGSTMLFEKRLFSPCR